MVLYFKAIFLPVLSLVVFIPFYFLGLIYYFYLMVVSLFYFPYRIKFYDFSLSLSLAIDQLANASINGNEDQTVSGRLGYAIYYKGKDLYVFVILCKILSIFFRQSKHCYDAIEYDRIDND